MSAPQAADAGNGDSRPVLTLWNSVCSEWTKVRSLRSTAYLLAATVGVSLVLTTAYSFVAASEFHAPSGDSSGPLDPSDPTGMALFSVLLAQLAIMAFGVLVMTGEYATHTIQPSLTAQPRRGQLFAAKAIVTVTVSLITGAVSGLGAFTAGQVVLASQGVPTANLSQPHVLRAVLGVGIYFALIGLLALAVGAITRATSGGLAIMIIGGLMLPNLAALLPAPWDANVQRYWPTVAGLQITNVESDPGMLQPWNGAGLLAAFAGLAVAVAITELLRRDA
ncbi:MAG: ABC transporter permease [Bifidobacteriaceae bacterium]|jgi:ABC-type transport system involved in multi-copper enzyme maturation permease subunit|nr:ABC transporter permease [Bifidobacteriaceae bacterium]